MHNIPPELQGPLLYSLCLLVLTLVTYLAKRAFEDLTTAVKTLTDRHQKTEVAIRGLESDVANQDVRIDKLERKAGI